MVTETRTVDEWEQALGELESQIARCRSLQLEALRHLDAAQVTHLDGSRSLEEWVAARLDIRIETARDLVEASRRLTDHPDLAGQLEDGEETLDRVLVTARFADCGAPDHHIDASWGLDIAGVERWIRHRRRLTPRHERERFERRFLVLQPSLDEGDWRLWGRLPGYEGRVVEKALLDRGEEHPHRPDEPWRSRGQRNADALVAMSLDTLDPPPGDGDTATGMQREPLVSVFVDAHLAAATRGEAGAALDNGPRIGPDTLDRILCDGRVEINVTTPDGTPLAMGPATRVIPPRLRRWILHRDAGCTITGCHSRYRLQVHHITPRSHGGTHHPHNLTTLCWFHHHVVIHGHGRHIDPASPPQRRHLLPPQLPRPPPPG